MPYSRNAQNRKRARKRAWPILIAAATVLLAVGIFALTRQTDNIQSPSPRQPAKINTTNANPLEGKQFYVDTTRTVNQAATQFKQSGRSADAALLDGIGRQPGAKWLTGPNGQDTRGDRDIQEVSRISRAAAAQDQVALFQLYAFPGRDACAGYSSGGFTTDAEYLAWIDRIVGALQGDVAIMVEADAIAHTLTGTCLSSEQINKRYQLISQAVDKLQSSPRVLAIYIDAGHSDWIKDPAMLIEPLRKSAIAKARGIVVNVSFFASTAELTDWSKQIVEALGDDIGVIIDTSRNGKGISPQTGDARWCNPSGRGTGALPTTKVEAVHIDAYAWIKNVGESDGACFGYPAAGTFVPELALELARGAVR